MGHTALPLERERTARAIDEGWNLGPGTTGRDLGWVPVAMTIVGLLALSLGGSIAAWPVGRLLGRRTVGWCNKATIE